MGVLAEAGRQVRYMAHLSSLLGTAGALRFRAAMFGPRLGLHDGKLLQMHHKSLLHPVTLRIASTDAEVFGQVIGRAEYAGVSCDDPRVIVDCGANVGFTSAFFLSRFPRARVIAIEPFPANAALCRRNLAPYGDRAQVIEAAVWGAAGRLVVEPAEGNEWGIRVRRAEAGEAGDLDGISIASLGLDAIDILKVDIEGSEIELFSADSDLSWLDGVRNMAIELHGPECERVVRGALWGLDFRESVSGELNVFLGMHRRAPA
jgi:FkbM family methyltransferase